MQALTYCGQLVKDNDPDRFFLSLLAPSATRENLWALFAFNHEIARIRETVTESLLGRIRLQWWRESVQRIYEGGLNPPHPILDVLTQMIAALHLPRFDFDALLDAHEATLMEEEPQLKHACAITRLFYRLAVRITGGDAQDERVLWVADNEARVRHAKSVRGPDLQALSVEFRYVRPQGRFLKGAQKLAEIYWKQLCRRGGQDPAIPPKFKEIRVFAGSVF